MAEAFPISGGLCKTRVKTGCVTCRIRRVKCDEAKPECRRCTTTGRKCDGYTNSSVPRKNLKLDLSLKASWPRPDQQPLLPAPSSQFSSDLAETRGFNFFRHRTLSALNEYFEDDFWSRHVLQLSHLEPAVKYGMLALSAWHEMYDRSEQEESKSAALLHYSKAIEHSRQLLASASRAQGSIERVLTACLLFVCYENLTGNFATAYMHLQNGQRLIQEHGKSSQRPAHSGSDVVVPTANDLPSTILSSITSVLCRFDLEWMALSESRAPYTYDLESPPPLPQIPNTYPTLAEARDHLVLICQHLLWTANYYQIASAPLNPQNMLDPCFPLFKPTKSTTPLVEALTHRARSSTALAAWFSAFNSLPQEKLMTAGARVLDIYHCTATVIHGSVYSNSEMEWDSYLPQFAHIVKTASELPKQPNSGEYGCDSGRARTTVSLAYDLGPLVPLYLTSHRCRDPRVRHAALSLLSSENRVEGAWDSKAVATVAAYIIQTETRSINQPARDMKDIPEENRVRALAHLVRAEEQNIEVQAIFLARDGNWRIQQDLLTY